MMTTDLLINLAASFIALLVGLFWKEKIVPWLRKLLYRGIIIHGKWRIEQADQPVDGGTISTKRDIYVDLIQRADVLSGTATSIASYEDGTQDFIIYDVNGEIRDRFVTIYLKVNDSSRIAYSSFLLEVVGNGQLMKGYRVFYGFKKQEIRAIGCTWVSANAKKGMGHKQIGKKNDAGLKPR